VIQPQAGVPGIERVTLFTTIFSSATIYAAMILGHHCIELARSGVRGATQA
jgi:hypothetical protein